ncbi:MAG TPA: lipid-A-disaccharide synthase [Bacteroidales bacterium]|nr:lipid-A-disaccharide synthase [Bacteroidales bacterium]
MKYFLVAGEASGDLHGSNLMRELRLLDPQAEFRFFGGDKMAAVGGTLLKHYREMAFMGIVAVVSNARTLLKNLAYCKKEIANWKPDILILIDYADFNLKVAAFVKENLPSLPVHFYISPKIWAWKEYRIKAFKKYIDKMYVILPFETAFFSKHDFPVTYVGNPSVDSVEAYFQKPFDEKAFRKKNGLDKRPILTLLPGSRKSEIHGNLPLMLEVASQYPAFQVVVAGAPGQTPTYYEPYLVNGEKLIFGETYSLLRIAHTAIVTSGTATLETALIGTPQVVTFAVGGGNLPNWIFRHFMHVPYFSLVNLIAGKIVVNELMGGLLNKANLTAALEPLLSDTPERQAVLDGYTEIRIFLGKPGAARQTAYLMHQNLTNKNE